MVKHGAFVRSDVSKRNDHYGIERFAPILHPLTRLKMRVSKMVSHLHYRFLESWLLALLNRRRCSMRSLLMSAVLALGAVGFSMATPTQARADDFRSAAAMTSATTVPA